MSRLHRFNDRLAVRGTRIVGTMSMFYIFVLVMSVAPVLSPSVQRVLLYVSSGVLQLSLLPLIMVGQRVLGFDQEMRAGEMHDAVLEALEDHRQELELLRQLVGDKL